MIDVCNNGGGSTSNADSVAQVFIKEKGYAISKIKRPIYIGTYKAWGSQDFNCPIYLDQPVVVLANENTASAAEDFLVELDSMNRVTIVENNSFGSTGQPILGDLPGGGRYRICTQWCSYPNGKEFINIGVQPKVSAVLSIDDWKNKNDSVFKNGVEVLRAQIQTK